MNMSGLYFDGHSMEYLENLDMPEPTASESLIKIYLAAICNTDKEILKGYRPEFKGIMGHEFVGIVIKSHNSDLIGRRVVGELNAGCGNCIYCNSGREKHCESRRVLGIDNKDGTFAEYMTIETHLLHLVPDSLSDQEAIFTEPLAAAIEILDQIHLHHDKNIAILGDGRLSNMIAQVIALTGADVTVIGRHKDKLEKFASFAKVTVQPEGTFEIVVDATGSPSGIKDAQKLVRKQGIIILKSTYAGKVELDMSWFAVNEITLIGSRCGPFEPALRLLTKRYVKFPEIELYSLSEFNQAFVSKAFKVGFKINQNNKEDIIYESSI